MTSDFRKLYENHNGARYLTPTDLLVTDSRPRRVLIVGSCLADVWQSQINCPCDFVMTNGLSKLPDNPPYPVDQYDLQLIQIPLRFVMPEDTLWHISFLDIASYEEAFEESLQKLKQYLAMACFWNVEHGLLTFIANLLVPQQNPMGRFAPRYDLRNPVFFIEQLNFYIAEEIKKYSNAFLLDIDGIASAIGKKYIQDDAVEILTHGSLLGDSNYSKDEERLEHIEPMTRHYGLQRDTFIAAIWHHAAAMFKTTRQEDNVKLVIIDLDNTLWRGVVVEEGQINDQTLEGWPLGLVEALVYLKKRGMILAIASKNDEAKIRALWPEIMRGRFLLEDFAIVKINWKSKIENIEEILKFVNVLPRHTLFIDDNPVEREGIQAAFPDIRVLGKYPYYLKRTLLWSPETQVIHFTEESSKRTEMLHAQADRESLRKQMSRDDFLATLQIIVESIEIMSVQHPNFARAFELINKTNQFNTSGIRWTTEECDAYFRKGGGFYAFKVKDRISDYGLVGCAIISLNQIEQFVMSCRVIGLGVEQKVVSDIAGHMRKVGTKEIRATLIETKDNFPCRALYAQCGFTQNGNVWTKYL